MRACVPVFLGLCVFVSSAQTIQLDSEKQTYLEDDVRALHDVEFAPAGERIVLRAAIDGLDWDGPHCPALTEIVRLPDGSERVDELGRRAECVRDSGGSLKVKFDAGHLSYWSGLGDYRIRLRLGGKYEDAKGTFPISNEICLKIVDALSIGRNWGPKVRGVAVDLSLDKESFALGEDVALHIAVENVDAEAPIYGYSPSWDPFHAVKIAVREANGEPVKQTCMRVWTSGGPAAMWRYPRGMIVPMERSLAGDGILPDHTGTFRVWITWSVFRGQDDSCHACQVPSGFDFERPYAVARSMVRTFQIKDGEKPAVPCY
ncbi:MAG: hypothetical protein JO340_21585 [Acidobacteriaceae bacterium]|nr:hypothetical protein [Acidobacteriaceae bacterium]